MTSKVVALREYKLVVIGGGGVGKSALVAQFIQSRFLPDYDPTIEDSYRKSTTIEDQNVILDILDTAGQEEYAAMREVYLRGSEAFICVYSITSRASFDEVAVLYQQICRVKDRYAFPMVLVGNKADLGGDVRCVTTEEGRALAERCGGAYFLEASAKTRTGVDDIFIQAVREVRRHSTVMTGGAAWNKLEVDLNSGPPNLGIVEKDLNSSQRINARGCCALQ